jgi:integrase
MKLVDEAEGDDGAMMLCMMNFAMYLQETIDLRWKKIKPNGSLIAHRAKSGRVVRVATLWPETIEALAKVKRRGEFIFYGAHGKQIGIKGAEKGRSRHVGNDPRRRATSRMRCWRQQRRM